MPTINQHIEAARKVYETYWESYTKGDLEAFISMLDETYEMIGTSEKEICHTKADGIAFIKAQIAEIVGKAELRNRQIDILPVDQLMLVNEHSDIFVLADSTWNFYSKIRISTLLRETETGWKVFQQHGSLPDIRVQEGETMAIEKINRENIELRDAVKRRTAELTAGIAHEIQNPLYFVNNFSEVSSELIEEMKEYLEEGSRHYAVGSKQSGEEKLELVKEIAMDIKQNLEKINHHGKRADGIVKGMLQHSRTSTGQKEPTDINALADEYLRLSYHGLRDKDKSFNAELKTEFDPNLPKVNVIPQDIGRVLLNLINNAFYACAERSRSAVHEKTLTVPHVREGTLSGLNDSETYKPTVTVSTKNLGDRIEISVKDNGNGIPEEIKNKIFQPFFTTKPTGQGTGLGLSLSYDIVKAHGGEIQINSAKGEGSEFIITLKTN